MSASSFQIRLCVNPACGLRYPLVDKQAFGERCPACMGVTRSVLTRIINSEPMQPLREKENQLSMALLDNIRSAWNVGSMFRTADGYGIRTMHLCGITPSPSAIDISKTALGAENSIEWKYHKNSVLAAESLANEGLHLWALEQDPRSIPITEIDANEALSTKYRGVVLVVGNEETGIDPDLLDLCHKIIYLPMQGAKRSFNVSVAFGITTQFLSYLFQQN